jgi:hypothetical protein
VDSSNIVKGYEVGKGEYIEIEPDDHNYPRLQLLANAAMAALPHSRGSACGLAKEKAPDSTTGAEVEGLALHQIVRCG